MKRCPTCNQTFEEDWLSFCTHDGTTLVDEIAPTEIPVVPTPESVDAVSKQDQQATWNLPVNDPASTPSAVAEPHAVIEPVWQPPPPPTYAQPENKSLATASMIVGIASMACLGPIPAIIAIILGGVALSQIKKNPGRIGGRQSAIVGIVTGSLGLVIYGGIMIAYIAIMILGASAR
jgi:hypothetical protein